MKDSTVIELCECTQLILLQFNLWMIKMKIVGIFVGIQASTRRVSTRSEPTWSEPTRLSALRQCL
jgi:hypothetical protein